MYVDYIYTVHTVQTNILRQTFLYKTRDINNRQDEQTWNYFNHTSVIDHIPTVNQLVLG